MSTLHERVTKALYENSISDPTPLFGPEEENLRVDMFAATLHKPGTFTVAVEDVTTEATYEVTVTVSEPVVYDEED